MAEDGTDCTTRPQDDPILRWNGALRVQESFLSMDKNERLDSLVSFMEDEEADIRGVAADIVMKHIADIPAVAATTLVDLYSRDGDPNLRAKAAEILFNNFDRLTDGKGDGKGADGQTVRKDTALRLINDENISVRRVAGKALTAGFDGFPSPLRDESLTLMAEDDDPWVRRAAAKTLIAHLDKLNENLRQLLDKLEEDPDGWVREGMLEESARNFDTLPDEFKERYMQAASEGLPEDRRRALTGLLENLDRFDEVEVGKLFKMFLSDAETDIRREAAGAAAELMERIPRSSQAEVMTELTASPDKVLRRTASTVIIDIYPKADPPIRTMLLVRLMNDEDQSVRYGVLEGMERSMCNLEPQAALSLLENYSKDRDVWVRNMAAQLLMDNFEYMGEEALAPLLHLCLDEDIRVRRSVVQGLSRHGGDVTDTARSALQERFLADEDPFVLKTLAEIAAADWERADDALRAHLLQALYSEDASIRLGAGTAVLDGIDWLPEHLAAKCRHMAEPSAPEEVRRGFMDIFGERFPVLPDWFRMEVLDTFVKDSSPWIRARAVDALNSSLTPELVRMTKRIIHDLWDDPDIQVKDSLMYLMLEQLPVLGKTGLKTVDRFMDKSQPMDVRVRIAPVVMRHRSLVPGNVPAFLKELAGYGDPTIRLDVFEVFAEEYGGLPPDERRQLLNIFCKDGNDDVRLGALQLREEMI